MSTIKVPVVTMASAIVQDTKPTSLVVIAVSIMPTGGYQNPRLEPRIYVTPPSDGIWEFDLFIDEPSGLVTDVLTPYTAAYEWIEYNPEQVKGVKIFGAIQPKVVMLE